MPEAPAPTDAELRQAVDVVKAYLRKEFIVDSCRQTPCFACASCEAVRLETSLDGLLALVGDDAQGCFEIRRG